MTKALRTSVRSGGLRQGGLQAGLGSDNIFATASLDLNFAVNKNLGTLVDATTGSNLIDFTRASSGTYVGSDGLIKTATTNLVLQSEDFSTTWTTTDLTVSPNTTTAPDGKLTADTLTIGSGVAAVMPSQSVTLANSTTYTISVYINSSQTCDIVRFRCTIGGSAYFTVSTKTWSDLGSGWTGGTYQELSGGWIRASIQFAAGPTDGGSRSFSLGGVTTAGGTTPDTGNTLIYWGAQLEQSSTVGEYIKTTSTINSAARFDHDPETGESLGLLVEESRTNLLLQSEEFGAWSSNAGTISPDSATSPNGAVTADKLIATNGGPNGQLFQSLTITSGATVTGSVYVKAGGFDRIELVLLSNNNTTPYGRATFDPNTGTIAIGASTSNGGTNAFASVANVGSGWYRCIVTVTYPAVTDAGIRLNILNSDASNGDGVKGVFLWGAQLEAGSFPTSYIPTEGSTVTRAADVASITGSNFSSWYRQEEGTVFADAEFPRIGVRSIWMLNNAANNVDTIDTHFNNNLTFRARKASANLFGATINTASDRNKTSFAFMDNNFGASANGELSPATGSGTISVPTFLEIGSAAYAGLSPLNGTIRRLVYWGQRLPDSTLVNITT